MKVLMSKGSGGAEVQALRKALSSALGGDAANYPSLSQFDGTIDDDFDSAIKRWQSGVGIIADGIVGPRCQMLLGILKLPVWSPGIEVSVSVVSQLFPATKPANIARYLPYVESALLAANLIDRAIVLGAFGTIRAETEGFVPLSEFQSKFNTAPGGLPFGLYDSKLGNGPGEGQRYRGRGFVQLTGKVNYVTYGDKIGLKLVDFPDLANAPEVAAVLIALFLADRQTAFRTAVAAGDLEAARKLVNGGSHGLDRFEDVFDRARTTHGIVDSTATKVGRGKTYGATKKSAPRSKRIRASKTKADSTDLRDREFVPIALSLPDAFPNDAMIRRYLPAYKKAKLILDQGHEGACTGFGLACVINYLRFIKADAPPAASVSPRMLYTLARRYDEYAGDNYEGSSCRGAIKGWFNNGVCLEPDWPYETTKSDTATYGFAERATQTTLGVYYRVDKTSIVDMQAAIAQHNAVFVSANTHDGWDVVKKSNAPKSHAGLPAIPFDGRPSEDGGHAFALVGYNGDGFVIQNSWGNDFGAGGFAVLSYFDWLANGMDAWVVSLGVPGVVAGRMSLGNAQRSARAAGTDQTKWWDATLAYQHSIVLGNDGRVSRYMTEDEPPRKLQQQGFVLPNEWFRGNGEAVKRLVVYIHGGLNSEDAAIKRVRALGRFFLGNGCYPLFLVWKTGFLESLGDIFNDARAAKQGIAGAGFGEWLSDKTDLLLEKTVGRPLAKPLWSEMKENAQLAFAERRGGELMLDAVQQLAETWGEKFELHLIGHSAGSIAMGHLLTSLAKRHDANRDSGLRDRLASLHLYAPACTVAFANRCFANDPNVMSRLHIDLLDDDNERADNVGKIYRKSLLYFVSNALEADQRTPILGINRVNAEGDTGWDGSSDTSEALSVWRNAVQQSGLSRRIKLVATKTIIDARGVGPNGADVIEPAAHGSFDNDVDVVSRTIGRILGRAPAMTIDDLRGY